MNRLYVKNKSKWLTVGWVCPNCGYIKLDEEKFPIKQYRIV
jgi:rubrerythrin